LNLELHFQEVDGVNRTEHARPAGRAWAVHGGVRPVFAARVSQVASTRPTMLPGRSAECPDVESVIGYPIEEEKSYRFRAEGEQREAFEVQV
jgi:hypothetical protein